MAFTGDPVNPIELPDFNELLDRYDSNEDDRLVQSEISEDLALIYRLGPAFGVKNQFSRFDTDQDGAINEEEWKRAASNIARMRPRNKDALVAIRSGGEGDVTESHVQWKVNEGVGQVASPLVYRVRVYLVKHGGNITCFNAETGDKVYSEKLGLWSSSRPARRSKSCHGVSLENASMLHRHWWMEIFICVLPST